jgi:hypothetical protein
MKENKKKDQDEMLDLMIKVLPSMHNDPFGFFNAIMNHPSNKFDENDLGRGFRLVPDDTIENNKNNYSLLYKDGKIISNIHFRLGGIPKRFGKDNDFCSLIAYPELNTKKEEGTWGNHCIINMKGEVVLMANKFETSFYYWGGALATIKDVIYNLYTLEPIVESTSKIESENFYFAENRYNDKYQKGVYKINKKTGEYEIFQ